MTATHRYALFTILILVSIALTIVSLYIPAIAQIGILLYGLPALFIVGFKDHDIRRWAYIMGILGQSFWYITTINNGQWGMVVLCTFYTVSWSNGTYQHWIKKTTPMGDLDSWS